MTKIMVYTAGRKTGKIAGAKKAARIADELGKHVHYISPRGTYCNMSCPDTLRINSMGGL